MLEESLVETAFARALLGAALLATLVSAFLALKSGTAGGALSGYRWAVHGTTAALLAPAVPLLGPIATALLLFLGVSLVERAFAKTKNP
jgi:hypothetical protein